MHVLITNKIYVIVLGRKAVCETVSGLFAVSFHSPLRRLPYFFLYLTRCVCVGLGVDFGPSTGPPARAQEIINSHSISPPFSTALAPRRSIPHHLAKTGVKGRGREECKDKREIDNKKLEGGKG